MATTFSAVDIKQLWYAETTAVTADLTGASSEQQRRSKTFIRTHGQSKKLSRP